MISTMARSQNRIHFRAKFPIERVKEHERDVFFWEYQRPKPGCTNGCRISKERKARSRKKKRKKNRTKRTKVVMREESSDVDEEFGSVTLLLFVIMGNCWSGSDNSIYKVAGSNSVSPKVPSPWQRVIVVKKLPSNPEEVEDLRRDSATNPLTVFTFEEIKIVTANFRPDRLLGGGGFCSVYKGFVSDDLQEELKPLQVAVKVHDGCNSHQGHREWLAEVIFLGQLSHPNLVKLLGYCCEDDHRMLI
ncbi:putative serine/threonine-protein kinase PBL16 [Drosera capensis]